MSTVTNIEEFREKVAALPREEIIDLIRAQDPDLVKQLNRVEWVFENKLQHLGVDGKNLSNEELALIVDPPFIPNKDLDKMGVSREQQRQVHIASDVVLWAKHFLDAKPRVYQILLLRDRTSRKVLRWGRRLGKALALDTPIPTPNGWVNMGDLKAGDKVFDDEGKPCNVTYTAPVQYDKTVYDVVFSDGSVITADADHLWVTHTKAYRKALGRAKNTRLEPSLVTTQQIKDTLRVGKKNEANHAIPLTEPVQYQERDLPIDPYVLGVWLGDGVTREASLSIHEQEILNNIKDRGYELTQWQDPNMYTLHGVSRLLDDLNLRGNKHIPEIYLRASVAQRRELLAGLMDSDGNAREADTHCEYSSKLPALAEGVRELVASLGLRPTLRVDDAKLYGKICGKRYRVGFSSFFYVFNIDRKNEMQTLTEGARVRYRYITEIRERDSVPVRCIEVDSDSRLFLAGKSYIPTHNTWSLAVMLLHYSYTTKNGRCLVMAPMKSQVSLIYEEAMKLAEQGKVMESITRYVKSPQHEIHMSTGSTIRFFTTGMKSGSKSDIARGQEAHIIVLDEMDYMGTDDLDALYAMMQRTDENQPEKLMIGASTPSGRRERFYDWCTANKYFREFYFPSYCNPLWDKAIEQEMREEYSEIAYRHEIEADWGEDAEGVYPRKYVDRAFTSPGWEYKAEVTSSKSFFLMGVDWDKYGAGPNICVLEACRDDHEDDRFAGRLRVAYREEIPRSEYVLTKAVRRIIDLNQTFKPEWIYVDKGYGEVQVELLHQHGVENPASGLRKKVKGVSFSETFKMRDPASKQEVKKDMKPFMVDNLRTLLERDEIVFPEHDEELYAQLISYIVVRTTSAGRPVFEASGSQQDHAHDALMLACLAFTQNYDRLMKVKLARHSRSISNDIFLPIEVSDEDKLEKEYDYSDRLTPIRRRRSGVPRKKRGSISRNKF